MIEINVTNCDNCPFMSIIEDTEQEYLCAINKKSFTKPDEIDVPDNCPLKKQPIKVAL